MGYNDTTYMTDFYRYDPQNNQWATVASIGGIPRYWSFGFSLGNYGYVGTGSYHNISVPIKTNDFWRLSDCDGSPVGIISIPSNVENYNMIISVTSGKELQLNYEIGSEQDVLFSLYNGAGQLIVNTPLPVHSSNRHITKNLQSGIYFYTVGNSSHVLTNGKVVVN
jgi:hypothetical protein